MKKNAKTSPNSIISKKNYSSTTISYSREENKIYTGYIEISYHRANIDILKNKCITLGKNGRSLDKFKH